MKKIKKSNETGRTVRRLAGICPICRRPFTYPRRRRTATAYTREERNWLFSCRRCYETVESMYESQWDEYAGSLF